MKRRNAFTLVELLVVIAIIAVLISILLPALSRVRLQAYSVQCMSNLRQVGLVVLNYTSDNFGKLPYNYIYLQENASYPQQLDDTPFPGLMAEGRFARGSQVTLYRSWNTTPNTYPGSPYAPPFLQCPADRQDNWHSAWSGYGVGRFAEGPVTLITAAGPEEGSCVYSDLGLPSVLNLLITNYTFNTFGSRIDATSNGGSNPTEPFGTSGNLYMPASNLDARFVTPFANYCDSTTGGSGSGCVNPMKETQTNIGHLKNSSNTWMAFDGAGEKEMSGANGKWANQSLSAFGIVFCHPNNSANFLYFDGHVENIQASQIDGAASTTASPIPGAGNVGVVLDYRMLPQFQ